MPYIIILKVRKFHQSTRNRFGTAGKKPVGGHSLKRVNKDFSNPLDPNIRLVQVFELFSTVGSVSQIRLEKYVFIQFLPVRSKALV